MKSPSVQWLLAAYLVSLAFIFGMGWPWPHDPDIWWHLKTGEWIASHRAVPWNDPFSAGLGGSEWIAYSWLAELLFHEIDTLQPILGLHLLQGVILASTALVLLLHARARSGSFRAALLLTLFFLVPQEAWVARPQIFSFLFTAIAMWLLWLWRQGNPLAPWLLPPLMLIWANIHVYFIVGIGLVVLHAADDWRHRPARRPAYLAVTLLCLLAPLLNPYGIHLYREVFSLALHGSNGWAAEAIRELASPGFHDWPMQVFFVWFAGGGVILAWSAKRPGWLTSLLFLGLLYQALQHRRDVAYFAIVLLPIFAEHLAHAPSGGLQRFFAPGAVPGWRNLSPPLALAHWCAALGVLLTVSVPVQRLLATPASFMAEHRKIELTGAVQYLLQHRPPGPLYNSLTWGGYLIYSLYPVYQVYIDNRTQLYSDAFWEAHNRVRHGQSGWGKPDWHTLLAASGARVVVWERDEPLVSLLSLSPDWTLRYEDKDAAVFVRKEPPQ